MTVLIFDCDGVLVDSELLHAQTEVDLIQEKFGLVSTAVAHNRKFAGAGDAAMFTWLREQIGHDLPQDFADELAQRKIVNFEAKLRPMSYIKDSLDKLSAVPKAVASNTALKTLTVELESTGLARLFGSHIYSAEMVAHGKPAPDLFLHAAKQMSARPSECVVIEDSKHGVEAALAAGMRVLGFTGGSHCYPGYEERLKGADRIFSDMRELPKLVADYF